MLLSFSFFVLGRHPASAYLPLGRARFGEERAAVWEGGRMFGITDLSLQKSIPSPSPHPNFIHSVCKRFEYSQTGLFRGLGTEKYTVSSHI